MRNIFCNLLATIIYFSLVNISFSITELEVLNNSISNNKTELERIEKEIKDYSKKISSTKSEAQTLSVAIKRLEESKVNLQNEIRYTEIVISNTNNKISETGKEIDKAQDRINLLNNLIASSFAELNQLSKTNNLLLLLDTTTINEGFTNLRNVNIVKNELNKNIVINKSEKTRLQEIKLDKEKYREDLMELKDDLSDKQVIVVVNAKAKEELLSTTKNKEALYKTELEARNKMKREMEKELLDFEAKLKAIIDVNKLPKQGSGVLSYPLKKITITQYFGNTEFSTKNPQVYSGKGHNGIDFAAPEGTFIFASADGTVIGLDDTDINCKGASYGKWVLIKHNNGLTTLYAHLSSYAVKEGDKITIGQKIGTVGNTGYSTGPHLHFAIFASDGVKVSGPKEYRSKSCGTYMRIPLAPQNAYLNPLSYL